jgi:protein disulfide-isomerase
MRKTALSLFLSALLLFPAIFFPENISSFSSLSWSEDYQKALLLAKEQKKPVFLYFSGSDWCPHCIAMQKDFFASSTFIEQVGDLFGFYQVDFPRSSSLPADVARLNYALKEKFQIFSFPSVVLVDPTEKEIQRWVGKPYFLWNFIEELKKFSREYKTE